MIKEMISMLTNNQGSEELKQPDVKLQRTWTNTCFEIVICGLLLVLWVSIAFKIAMSGGKPIPIHFDMAGHPDNYGSSYWLLLLGGVNTALAIYYMVAAYRPVKMISVNVAVRNMRQVWIIVRWGYVFAIEFTLFCTSMVYSDLKMMDILFKILLIVMIVTCLGMLVLLRKYK